MNPISKVLFTGAFVLFVLGLAWQFGGKFLGFGRLPGDIAVERENFRFYFPLASSLLLSVILTVIFYLIRRFSR